MVNLANHDGKVGQSSDNHDGKVGQSLDNTKNENSVIIYEGKEETKYEHKEPDEPDDQSATCEIDLLGSKHIRDLVQKRRSRSRLKNILTW